MNIFCCMDCPDRTSECHPICEKYQKELAAHKQAKEQRRIQSEHHRYILENMYEHRYEAAKKRKNQARYPKLSGRNR